ncbi:MAG: ribose transport system ATP-binding protein, partial [Mycobacterium sp.]|nr:ribose transport system ATP-binding protein [Mycobacterium sp.]
MTGPQPRLTVRSMRKSFGASHALSDVSLEIMPGEIHALLGHNGAGKSTLIGCLGGAFAPDGGEIIVDDKRSERLTPIDSIRSGIAIIYQSLGLVPTLSVADNIFLGGELRSKGLFVNRSKQRRMANDALSRFQPSFDSAVKVETLPVAEQQVVAITKAMQRTPSVLILDEPTAALSETEARALGNRLRELRSQGLAILYVTHLLKEVYQIADRVTVLRDGHVVLSGQVDSTPKARVVEAIAGVKGAASAPEQAPALGETMVAVNDLAGPRFGPVSFDLRSGEVVGIYGLLGSGRTEILEAIFGRGAGTTGSVRAGKHSGVFKDPAHAIRHGLALVPAERLKQGLLPPMSNRDNALLASFNRLGRGGFRSLAAERDTYRDIAASLGIKPADPGAPVRSLSGG